ncbi:unnamed protein product, partial [Closterium sp. Naga37s-1]
HSGLLLHAHPHHRMPLPHTTTTKHQHEAHKEVAKEGNGAVGAAAVRGGKHGSACGRELAAWVVEQFVLGTCGTRPAAIPPLPGAPALASTTPRTFPPTLPQEWGEGRAQGAVRGEELPPGSGGGSGAGRAPGAGGAAVPAGRGAGEAESSDWGTGSEGGGRRRGQAVGAHCHDAPHKVPTAMDAPHKERETAGWPVLDACAARTSALPLAAAAALPTHCARLLPCAASPALFMLAGQGRPEDTVASSSVAVGRLVLPSPRGALPGHSAPLTADSLQAGGAQQPCRQCGCAEMLLLLQELVRLVLHPLVAAAVDVPIAPKASAEAHVTAQAAAAGDTLTRGELERAVGAGQRSAAV